MTSLADDLGYHHRVPNAAQRAVRRLAMTRGGAWLFAHLAPSLDRWYARRRRGRTAAETLAGLATIFVTTTGARSGVARTSPLAGIPHGDALALVGTHFGQRSTPGWYFNLRKDPHAEVRYGTRSVKVRAREATPAEHARVMETAFEVYAGYRLYEQRITGRPIHVMMLERDEA